MTTTRSKLRKHPEGYALDLLTESGSKLCTVYGGSEAETVNRAKKLQAGLEAQALGEVR